MKFCNRYKVHGFAWPQIASGWTTLSEKERMDGAEAILAAGKGGATALVIGVQDKDNNIDKSIAYAKHAARNGADAIVSLPPEKADDKAMIEYYKTIGQATDLPLFVQTQGDMSVDLIVEMSQPDPHHEMREGRGRQSRWSALPRSASAPTTSWRCFPATASAP